MHPLSGAVARGSELGGLEDAPLVRPVHNLPPSVDSVHLAPRAQIPQSAYNQVHVIPHIAYLLDAVSAHCGHYSSISHHQQREHDSLLVCH